MAATIAHPFWFQPLGAVMGLDWRSSGTTTSVTGTAAQPEVIVRPILRRTRRSLA